MSRFWHAVARYFHLAIEVQPGFDVKFAFAIGVFRRLRVKLKNEGAAIRGERKHPLILASFVQYQIRPTKPSIASRQFNLCAQNSRPDLVPDGTRMRLKPPEAVPSGSHETMNKIFMFCSFCVLDSRQVHREFRFSSWQNRPPQPVGVIVDY